MNAAYRTAVALVVGLVMLAGCERQVDRASAAAAQGGLETLVLRYESQAGVVAPVELAEDLGYLAPVRLEFLGMSSGGPHNLHAVLSGDVDFGGSFNGSIAKVVASKAPVRAVVAAYGADQQTWFGYYVLEDSSIRTARDLLGKHVAMNTLGAHTEFLLKEYLRRNGVTARESEQVSMIAVPPINGEQVLRARQVEVAALGSIYKDRALASGGLRLLFSDVQLLGEFTAGSYFMSERFLRENPNTARKFVTAVARTLEWLRTTRREQVVQRMENIIARRGRNEDASAVKYWKSVSVPSKLGALSDADFQIWIDWLVRDGQLAAGQVRAADIYTNTYNQALAGP